MNQVVALYAQALGIDITPDPSLEPCAHTGTQAPGNHRTADIITDMNADRYVLECPASPRMCDAAADMWKRRELRTCCCLLTSNRLVCGSRSDLWTWLCNPPNPPYVVTWTATFKKHVMPKAAVTENNDLIMLCGENGPAPISREDLRWLTHHLPMLLMAFTKTEIETGQYNQRRIADFGIDQWHAFESTLRNLRRLSAFAGVLTAAPSKAAQEAALHGSIN